MMKEYVLVLPACPCMLWVSTYMVRAKDLGITRASKDLYASCFILNNLVFYDEFIFD